MANQEMHVLLLTPFTQTPKISFDNVRLGTSATRQLVVRNPGDKALDVRLDKLPAEEKGFGFDYTCFRLGPKEETTLLIGWTPAKGGGVRDNITVKFGSFRSQIVLIGSCVAPPEPGRRGSVRPLGPKNTNVQAAARSSRPSVPGSKLAARSKIVIPVNPVTRQENSPEKRPMTTADGPDNVPPEASTRKDPVSGRRLSQFTGRIPDQFPEATTPSRRETYVRYLQFNFSRVYTCLFVAQKDAPPFEKIRK